MGSEMCIRDRLHFDIKSSMVEEDADQIMRDGPPQDVSIDSSKTVAAYNFESFTAFVA